MCAEKLQREGSCYASIYETQQKWLKRRIKFLIYTLHVKCSKLKDSKLKDNSHNTRKYLIDDCKFRSFPKSTHTSRFVHQIFWLKVFHLLLVTLDRLQLHFIYIHFNCFWFFPHTFLLLPQIPFTVMWNYVRNRRERNLLVEGTLSGALTHTT